MKNRKLITIICVIFLVVLLLYWLFIAEDINAFWGTN